MKIGYVLLVLVFLLALNSYGESSESNDINAFAKACESSYNLGSSICECLAEKADERLTPVGFAFLVASMNNDEEEVAKLQSKLEMSESLEVGMFMVNTPAECSEEMEED